MLMSLHCVCIIIHYTTIYSGLADVITSSRGFLFKAHHAVVCCIQWFINTLRCQTRQPNVVQLFLVSFFKQESKCYPTFFFFDIFFFKQASKCCPIFFSFFTFAFSNKQPNVFNFFLFLLFLFQTRIQMVYIFTGLIPHCHNMYWIRTIPTTVSMVSAACIQLFINTLCW